MKAIIRKLSHEGDTVTEVEGIAAIMEVVEEILGERGHFLAVEGEVVLDADLAREKIMAVEEAELIVGKQVVGG